MGQCRPSSLPGRRQSLPSRAELSAVVEELACHPLAELSVVVGTYLPSSGRARAASRSVACHRPRRSLPPSRRSLPPSRRSLPRFDERPATVASKVLRARPESLPPILPIRHGRSASSAGTLDPLPSSAPRIARRSPNAPSEVSRCLAQRRVRADRDPPRPRRGTGRPCAVERAKVSSARAGSPAHAPVATRPSPPPGPGASTRSRPRRPRSACSARSPRARSSGRDRRSRARRRRPR